MRDVEMMNGFECLATGAVNAFDHVAHMSIAVFFGEIGWG